MISFKDFIKLEKEDFDETIDEAKMTPTQKIKRDIYLKTKLAPKIQKYISIYGKAKARSKMVQDANKLAFKPLGEDITESEWEELSDEDFDFVIENYELLSELSKKTLTSYTRKASDQAVKLRNSASKSHREANAHIDSLNRAHRVGDKENASHHHEISKAHMKDAHAGYKKSEKRLAGLDKAYKKLKEEIGQLDEIINYDYSKSDDKISHYEIYHHKTKKVVGKATTKNGARKSIDHHDNKYGGYAHGARAVYKEETEQLDELSKETLHSYKKKAENSKINSAMNYSHASHSAETLKHVLPRRSDQYSKSAQGSLKVYNKRHKGIENADNAISRGRYTKEELAKAIATHILETIITDKKITKEEFELIMDDLSSIMVKGE